MRRSHTTTMRWSGAVLVAALLSWCVIATCSCGVVGPDDRCQCCDDQETGHGGAMVNELGHCGAGLASLTGVESQSGQLVDGAMLAESRREVLPPYRRADLVLPLGDPASSSPSVLYLLHASLLI